MIGSKDVEKLVEYYRTKKLAHAYIISTNNIQKCLDVLLKVIKNIFCVSEFNENCNKCSLCHLIDINNLPSLKIIEPDGNFIKKEQILELKNLFSKSSQYTEESIYIIKNAEKLNKESANTMLKFLEEPEGNVIGFFITKEKDNIMPTIQSRCQTLELYFDNTPYENFGLTEDEWKDFNIKSLDYLEKIEIKKDKLIIYNRDLFQNASKDEVIILFQIILNIYQNELNRRFNLESKNSLDFLKNLTTKNICAKINLLIELLKEINYNVNIELFLDKFVIEMDGINNEGI